MKKGAKIAWILGIGGVAALAAWYFLKYLPEHPKNKDEKTDEQKLIDMLAQQGGATATTGNSGGYTPPSNSVIGKKMYATQNAVRVLYVSDASTYRTKNINEFIGIVDGEKTLAGTKFYTFGGGALAVAKNLVRLA